ncbi:uncharacterized protein LTR77_000807 [Saxophila tyrrhenica]|uniref:Uncharacterized protein n=1 Tax=Saxophila tyrrhenica TaxID=1690608 RepID=A0AAV9PQZ8_9PEZI|nr:hypothetical protein LTR77_000807 [Saxophila tyrrhenica]
MCRRVHVPPQVDVTDDFLIPDDDFYKDLFDRISTISGFLVIASYPIATQNTSGLELTHFNPVAVRTFAALSVGLFIASIVACQAYNLHRQKSAPGWILFRGVAVLFVMGTTTAATLFFFLTIAAYAYLVGMIFVGLTCLFAPLVLVPFTVESLQAWSDISRLLGLSAQGVDYLSAPPAQEVRIPMILRPTSFRPTSTGTRVL